MSRLFRFSLRRQEGGQSLVEVALFLPILLIMLVGIVEVGNLLVTQNRVTTAARTGAGFGATYYVENDWEGEGGTATAMGSVVLNTVTETLDLDPNVWDVWSIYGKIDEAGQAFETFDAVHVQGNYQVMGEGEIDFEAVKGEMIADLQAEASDPEQLAGLEVVASLAYHDLQAMLGLNVWQWAGYQTVRGLTVMRVDRPAPYIGCDLMPISVYWDQISRYPHNYNGPPVTGSADPQAWLFPEDGDFDVPDPGPDYTVPNPGVFANVSNFQSNLPGVPLLNGQRGYLYLARQQGFGSGAFGWLSWNGCTSSANCLDDSTIYPGNFWEEGQYIGSSMDMGTDDVVWNGEEQVEGDGDGALEPGEWIYVNTGNVNSNAVTGNLENVLGRTVRLIVFDADAGSGNNNAFRVYGFILVRIIGWDFTGNPKQMAFELIRWDATCDAPQVTEP